ncbi:hypothetical protein HMPREF1341_01958 [Enterococcus faecalis ERV81]|nr:hypothetical protein HMPREF1330_02369 [Enterococcus faecalis ERV129]EJV27899.1 hypothetical protein HMPREF1341_01958 [Enterococcus faecalis ERV81]
MEECNNKYEMGVSLLNNIHKCYILSESNDLQLIKWRFYE